MAKDPYWAIRPETGDSGSPANKKVHDKFVQDLKEGLLSSDIVWDEKERGYRVRYNTYSYEFYAKDPKNSSKRLQDETGKDMNRRELDIKLLCKKFQMRHFSGNMEQDLIERKSDSEFIVRPEGIDQSDVDSLKSEGKAQRDKYFPTRSYHHGY